jgi:hypothetical protein
MASGLRLCQGDVTGRCQAADICRKMEYPSLAEVQIQAQETCVACRAWLAAGGLRAIELTAAMCIVCIEVLCIEVLSVVMAIREELSPLHGGHRGSGGWPRMAR